MRTNQAGRNESLPRVSDEVAGFQVSPLGYLWAVATGPRLRACSPASAVGILGCVVWEESLDVKSKMCCAVKSQECYAVSCHTRHRAGLAQEPLSYPPPILEARSFESSQATMDSRNENRFVKLVFVKVHGCVGPQCDARQSSVELSASRVASYAEMISPPKLRETDHHNTTFSAIS
jgi:hypothetical protein